MIIYHFQEVVLDKNFDKTIGWKLTLVMALITTAATYLAYKTFSGYNDYARINYTLTYMYGDNSMDYYWGVTDVYVTGS